MKKVSKAFKNKILGLTIDIIVVVVNVVKGHQEKHFESQIVMGFMDFPRESRWLSEPPRASQTCLGDSQTFPGDSQTHLKNF